jgi:hypothetical protein
MFFIARTVAAMLTGSRGSTRTTRMEESEDECISWLWIDTGSVIALSRKQDDES